MGLIFGPDKWSDEILYVTDTPPKTTECDLCGGVVLTYLPPSHGYLILCDPCAAYQQICKARKVQEYIIERDAVIKAWREDRVG